ncbi:hypothetical protein [Streptomyces sp. NPDC016626]|uniref:hypothetical protein n=1 Tax=Streptomyces sp. NPDC016626 TaxID=3364968 RepID=UPI0036FAB3FD
MHTDAHHTRALRPVPAAGVLVHPTADRRLATEHRLLSTLPAQRRAQARAGWQEHGVALLPLGGLFSAVRLPASLVHAVTCGHVSAEDVDAVLRDALGGGPVICDQDGGRYYALVPATMPQTWHQAAVDWRTDDVDVLGRGAYLVVPRLDLTECDRGARRSYWSVPMVSADVLCRPLAVARLIAAARQQMPQEEEAL